ncbi:cytochrome c biogenesis protein ResB [Caldibacillus lycopersici]|uniref:Cytochrome c biogenesis protein ResB n=1 Tax=Perspicuibacillus lycopersici TaxID=1325689 RepID=A0AAE3ISD1_9BACI|nr:cytochrome c biogenesis protein ResB [Perspicuibacillus lycopersici]MCU9613748.1 cytochrome c biogenesis protein ResB [Perspicuibacillus lycopersici]
MNKIKCECGHVNPHGTVLCEACGKVLVEEEKKKKLLDMRYEGTARRSQTYNRSLVDKIWNFFSSVKVGVWLIVVTLIASALGTIFPQEMNLSISVSAEEYYQDRYGIFGQIYYLLGFHDLYRSWWYILLVASIGVSLVICSLDRAVPLYKALKKQRVTRHNSFLERQRFFTRAAMENANQDIELVTARLKKKHYKILEENGNVMAEKGRFSRWGPYVNHIGLILFLFGIMLRFVPGFYVNEQMWLKEGETKVIPGTDKQYYLANHAFVLELYDEEDGEVYKNAIEEKGGIVKNYQSSVTLYKAVGESLPGEKPELQEVKNYDIRVNQPLKMDHYAVYQSSYRLNEISAMTFALTNKETGEQFGNITIDLANPKGNYDLGNGYSVQVLSYFPDFEILDGEPHTKTPNPNNPAFAFKMITPDKPEGETSFAAIQQTIEPLGENTYKMAFQSVETVNYSGLTVRKDLTLGIISVGGIIFLLGVAQGSFWQHRRIWINQSKGQVAIAAHTNKNWFTLMKEIQAVLAGTNLPIPFDQQLDKEEAKQQGVNTVG